MTTKLLLACATMLALVSSAANADDFFTDAASDAYRMNQAFEIENRGFQLWVPGGGDATACFTRHGLTIQFNRWEGMQQTIEFLTMVPVPIPVQTIYGGAIYEGTTIVDHQRIGTSHWGYVNILNNSDTTDCMKKRFAFRFVEMIFGACEEREITQQYYILDEPYKLEPEPSDEQTQSRLGLNSSAFLQMSLIGLLYQESETGGAAGTGPGTSGGTGPGTGGGTGAPGKVKITITIGSKKGKTDPDRAKCVQKHMMLINDTKGTNCFKVRKPKVDVDEKTDVDGDGVVGCKLGKPEGWEKYAKEWKECVKEFYGEGDPKKLPAGNVVSHLPDMCLGGHPGPAGCFLIVPSGCNTAMGGACKLTKDPKDGTVWNEVCIRYADEKKGTLGDVINILTDKEKKDIRAKFKTQKDAWEGHVCADADCNKKLADALKCIDQTDKYLPKPTITKVVAPDAGK